MITGRTALYGVMGWPIAHSFSPALHNAWYAEMGIDAVYVPFPVPADTLAVAVSGLKALGCRGWNVTVPHKEAILSYLDRLDVTAHRIGAVNTVLVKDGALVGYNTDVEGYRQCLLLGDHPKDWASVNALIIGAGGAARAVVMALQLLQVWSISLTNRTLSKALALQQQFPDITIVPWDDRDAVLSDKSLVVQTTTLGLNGEDMPLALNRLPADALISDLIYKPALTPLLQRAKALGRPVQNGAGMLVYQAAAAFSLWFGIQPTVSRETIYKLTNSL